VYEKPTPMPEWTAKVIDIFRQLAAEAGRLKQRSWDVRTWSLRSVMDLHEVALRLLKVPCHEGYAFVGGAAAAAATTTAEMTRWQQHLEQWNQLVDVMEKQSWGDLAVGKGSPPVGVRLCDHPELGSAWVAIRELLHDGLTEAIGQYSRNLTFQEVPLARYLLKELGIDLVSLPTPQEMRRYFRTLREVLLNRVIRGALVTAVEIVDTATRVASTEQVWSRTGLRLAVDSALSDLEHLKGYCVGRPDELESWLWALVINSAEAGASRLWLRGKPLHVPDIGYVVCLSVADDGQGIPLSNLERLPATKRGHTGTSLRQILETVNAIRGALEVASLTPGGEAAVRHSAASGTTVRPSAWNSWPGHAGQGTIVRIMLPYYPGLLDQPKEQL